MNLPQPLLAMVGSAEHIAALIIGGGLATAGLWLLFGKRILGTAARPATSSEPGSPVDDAPLRLSEPTRLVIALCLVVVGYHVAAYGSPAAWFPLKVPFQRWWVLALGVVVAISGAILSDRMERLDDGQAR